MMTLKLEETIKSAGIDTRGLTKLDWPKTIPGFYSLQVEGTKAVAIWERLRAITEHTGFWPLIAGEEEHLTALRDNYEMEIGADVEAGSNGSSTCALIESGEALDLEQWFKSRVAEDNRYEECELGTWPNDLADSNSDRLALTHRYDYAAGIDKPFARVQLLFLPLTVPWQVPATLRLGGWNQCPQTETHIAIARSWARRYGAEIISASNNILEMRVNSPPKTKDDSMKIAREQFFYCGDLVHRKFKTLSALAANLMYAPYWSFWWT
jgi:hypothetical protein